MRFAFALVFAALIPGHAFAIHGYNQEDCTGSLKGKKIVVHTPEGDGWIQVHSELGVDPKEEGAVGDLVNPGDVVKNPADEIVVDNLKESKRIIKPYNDGCWLGTEGTVDRSLQVRSISPAAEKKLGFGAGQKLQVHCSFFIAEPSGSECPDGER